MIRKIILCFILLIHTLILVSQQGYLSQADQAYQNRHFDKAIEYFNLYENINQDADALKKRGASYLNYNLLDKAIEDFTAAKKLGNDDPLLFYQMGQCKQSLKAFDEASFFYKKYLTLSNKKSPYRKRAELELKNCVFSALQKFETAGTLIQSFGESVNSPYDEICPIQSPSFGNVFYFSSNRNKKDFDVFSFTLSDDGIWTENDFSKKAFNNNLNNYVLDVDVAKGNALLYKETDGEKPLIQFATYDDEGKDIVVQLPEDVFEGAEDISIVNHNLLVFASSKLDGYGGYDLYSILYKNGQWGKPSNLGSAINSPFDDRCPFFSHNLEHLYFSSNRPYCFGGYDLYYCDVKNQIAPRNMGYGVNSTGDELHFNIDDAGHMITFSSNRKTGLGGFDLYFGYLQDIKNIGIKDSITFEYLSKPDENLVFEKIVEPTVITTVPDTVLSELITPKPEVNIPETEKLIIEKDTILEALVENTNTKQASDTIKSSKLQEMEKATVLVEETPTSIGNRQEEKANSPKQSSLSERDSVTQIVLKETEVPKTTNDIVVEESPDTVVTQKPQPSDKSTVVLIEESPTKDSLLQETVSEQQDKSTAINPLDRIDSTMVVLNNNAPNFEKPKNWTAFKKPNTLLYEDRQDLIRGKNMVKLNQLIIEHIDNNNSIIIMAHTDLDELGLPEYVLYNSLKRANVVANYLVENGIKKDRIIIESVANNYPLIKTEIAGTKDPELYKLNKRIDILIYEKHNVIKEDALYNLEDIPNYAFDKRYELYRTVREGTYYSVEIASADRIFKNAILRIYNDIYIRRDKYDSQNKYYIGIYTQKSDAEKLQQQLKETSAPYAKIVKFENGLLAN